MLEDDEFFIDDYDDRLLAENCESIEQAGKKTTVREVNSEPGGDGDIFNNFDDDDDEIISFAMDITPLKSVQTPKKKANHTRTCTESCRIKPKIDENSGDDNEDFGQDDSLFGFDPLDDFSTESEELDVKLVAKKAVIENGVTAKQTGSNFVSSRAVTPPKNTIQVIDEDLPIIDDDFNFSDIDENVVDAGTDKCEPTDDFSLGVALLPDDSFCMENFSDATWTKPCQKSERGIISNVCGTNTGNNSKTDTAMSLKKEFNKDTLSVGEECFTKTVPREEKTKHHLVGEKTNERRENKFKFRNAKSSDNWHGFGKDDNCIKVDALCRNYTNTRGATESIAAKPVVLEEVRKFQNSRKNVPDICVKKGIAVPLIDGKGKPLQGALADVSVIAKDDCASDACFKMAADHDDNDDDFLRDIDQDYRKCSFAGKLLIL